MGTFEESPILQAKLRLQILTSYNSWDPWSLAPEARVTLCQHDAQGLDLVSGWKRHARLLALRIGLWTWILKNDTEVYGWNLQNGIPCFSYFGRSVHLIQTCCTNWHVTEPLLSNCSWRSCPFEAQTLELLPAKTEKAAACYVDEVRRTWNLGPGHFQVMSPSGSLGRWVSSIGEGPPKKR